MNHWIDYVVIALMVLSVVTYLVVQFCRENEKVQFSDYKHMLLVLKREYNRNI